MNWTGVMPAITTPFRDDGSVDHEFLARHARWMVDAGCTGVVPLGSLGEGATLEFDEKVSIVETCVEALDRRAPVAAAVAAMRTDEAVRVAQLAGTAGCSGLMILPPYVYSTNWREMKAHVSAVLRSTPLSCMLYNNPVAYRTDFLPEQIAELAAEFPNLHAVKESSADVRRITAIRSLLGDRLALFVGVDDAIVEGIDAGAVGWVAGLANALPRESVTLFDHARGRDRERTQALYRWFLPLLRLDTLPKFVQLIKLVQTEVGMGSERVRAPRLPLEGDEREAAIRTIRGTLASRPECP